MPNTAVIFDLDGVLIDSAPAHHESWRLLAKELGSDVTADQFAASFGRQNRDIIPLLFGGPADPDRIGRLSRRKEAIYRKLITGRMPAIAGGADLVRDCQRNDLKTAIGSSAPIENINLALGELGISGYFDAIVHDADVARGKPDPEVFLIAAGRLGVQPALCVVIEDAPSGIQAAKAAGMKAIGITTYHPAESLEGVDLVIENLTDLQPSTIATI